MQQHTKRTDTGGRDEYEVGQEDRESIPSDSAEVPLLNTDHFGAVRGSAKEAGNKLGLPLNPGLSVDIFDAVIGSSDAAANKKANQANPFSSIIESKVAPETDSTE